MNKYFLLAVLFIVSILPSSAQCAPPPVKQFIEEALKVNPEERETLILNWVQKYGLPQFMNDDARIDVEITDESGRKIQAYYFVKPDYLCVGDDSEFFRVPMQPKTAQRIADSLGYFLSTRKISDDVYQQAKVKLYPHPLTEDRDSFYTFVAHNEIIEIQRNGRTGLIAGHKKDVIITHRIIEDTRPNRLALYGWHMPDGKPIQPIYTGHIDWYVDYSHGFRLVSRTIYIDEKPMDYFEVMKHPVYSRIICDEDICDFTAYPY